MIENLFSFFWNYDIAYGHVLQGSSCIIEWRISSGIISRFDIDAASLWWRFRTVRGARSSWSWSLQAWYYHIFPNFHTLMILLQVDPASNDELETICEGCYETKDTYIFAWSSILDVGHYHWLRNSIRRLFPNSKANYLIRTIWHILNFLQLWTITMA